MVIKRLYYEIFADSIEASAKNGRIGPKERHFYTNLSFSLAQYLNIILLFFILSGLGFNINIFVNINIFPGKIINGFLSGFVSLGLPLLLINYFLVFHRKTYLKYTENRKIKTGGLALLFYFLGSVAIFIVYIVIGMMFFA